MAIEVQVNCGDSARTTSDGGVAAIVFLAHIDRGRRQPPDFFSKSTASLVIEEGD